MLIVNMVVIFFNKYDMMSAKLATPGLLEMKDF